MAFRMIDEEQGLKAESIPIKSILKRRNRPTENNIKENDET